MNRNANCSPNRQLNDYQNMQASIVNLSHTLNNHHAQELQNMKEKERKKADKKFDNLSEVQKTTIKMITIKPGQTDEDVDDLEATSTMRALLEQGTSIKVQAQLQHEYSRRRYICSLSSGMCTSIKQGTLASQPAYTNINGLSPLFSEVVLLKTNNHIKTYSNLRKIENFSQIANGQKLNKSTNNTIKSTLTT